MTLALLLTAATGAWAQTQWESGSCTVTLSNGTLTVSGKGTMADYMYNSDRPWDNNRNDITSVVVESGVTSVGFNAFYFFSNMTSVTLPEGLTAIGGMAFSGCSSLTSITIPSTVTSIGASAFMSCSAISDVNLYANPGNLTWGDASFDFKSGKATQCHVLAEHLSTYQNNFSSVNVTFVGDLKPLATSDVEVTTNAAEEGATFTEAWFNMPAYDATVTYELVRDMEYKVNAYVGDDAEVTYRHRVEKVSDNLYKPVNITDDAQIIALFNVIDTIDAASPKPLVYGTDFTVTIVDEDQNETVPAEFNFAPGIYTVKVTGIGDYDGLIDSRNQFKLYYGYELKVAPRNYATYYKDEPLTTANENAELYTIASINGSKAVLSEQMQSVPKNTPFLIYNNHQTDTVTFVLSPVEGGQLSLIQYAPEFKGTLNDSIMPASSEGTKYYICNGYDFVWVRDAGTIAANRCWLEISNSNARALNIVFDDEATSIKNLTPTLSEGEGAWYDLNGRKLNGMPTRKGVYILNGKKTVIK